MMKPPTSSPTKTTIIKSFLGRLLGLLDQYAMRLNRQVQANRMELIVKMKARAFIEKMNALIHTTHTQ